jgi:hypothetical protein
MYTLKKLALSHLFAAGSFLAMSADAGTASAITPVLVFSDTTPGTDGALGITGNIDATTPTGLVIGTVESSGKIYAWNGSVPYNTDGSGDLIAFQASANGDILWTITAGTSPQAWDAPVVVDGGYNWGYPTTSPGGPQANPPSGQFPNGVRSITVGQIFNNNTGDPGPWIVASDKCDNYGNSSVYLLEEKDVQTLLWYKMPGCLSQIAEDSSATIGTATEGKNIYGAAFDAAGNIDLFSMPLSPRNSYGVPTAKAWTNEGQILPAIQGGLGYGYTITSMAAVSGVGIYFTATSSQVTVESGLFEIINNNKPSELTTIIAYGNRISPRMVSRDYWNEYLPIFLGSEYLQFTNGVWSL